MPRTCNVPGCKTGYKKVIDEKYPTFAFPKDPERRIKWLKAIHRIDFEVSKNSSVCIRHFHPQHVVYYGAVVCPDGTVLRVKRQRPKLTKDAVPGVFETLPFYCSTKPPTVRKSPDDRKRDIVERERRKVLEELEKDKIKTFENLKENFASRPLYEFEAKTYSNFILLYKIRATVNDCPELSCCVKIFNSFKVQVFLNNRQVSTSSFSSVLGKTVECETWSKFDNLVKLLNCNFNQGTKSVELKICKLCDDIDSLIQDVHFADGDSDEDTKKKLIKLNFLHEQFKSLL